MKRIILSLFILLLFSIASFAQDTTTVAQPDQGQENAEVTSSVKNSDRAIEAYNNGQFAKAIELLEKEKDEHLLEGKESAELYYNLGNAYFRVNEVDRALLYYERALLLKPGDRDIRHNINYANTKIEDKIVENSSFFLSSWLQSIQNMMSSNSWAWLAVVGFILFVACLFLFFFSKERLPKQVAFYAGIVFIVLIIFGNVFSFRQKIHMERRDSAIIMAASVVVRSSPDNNSKEIFLLHSGTKVKVTKNDRDWCEIEIANGSVGWIEKEKLEVI